MFLTALLYLSFLAYLSSGVLYLLQFVFTQSTLSKRAWQIACLAWALQTLFLSYNFFHAGYPFLIDAFSSYLFTVWVLALAFLLLNWRQRFSLLGSLDDLLALRYRVARNSCLGLSILQAYNPLHKHPQKQLIILLSIYYKSSLP